MVCLTVEDNHVPQGAGVKGLCLFGLRAVGVQLFGFGIVGVQGQQVGLGIGLCRRTAGRLIADVLTENNVDGGVRVGGVGAVVRHVFKFLTGCGRRRIQGVGRELLDGVRAVVGRVHCHIVHVIRALFGQARDGDGEVHILLGRELAGLESAPAVNNLHLGVLAAQELRVRRGAGLRLGIFRAAGYSHPVNRAVLVDRVGQLDRSGLGGGLEHIPVELGRGDVLGFYSVLGDFGGLGAVRVGEPQVQVIGGVLLHLTQAFHHIVQVQVNLIDFEAVHGVLNQVDAAIAVGVHKGGGQELAGLGRGAARGQKHIVQITGLVGHDRGLQIHNLPKGQFRVGVCAGGGAVCELRRAGQGRDSAVRGENLLGLHRAVPAMGVHQHGREVIGAAGLQASDAGVILCLRGFGLDAAEQQHTGAVL